LEDTGEAVALLKYFPHVNTDEDITPDVYPYIADLLSKGGLSRGRGPVNAMIRKTFNVDVGPISIAEYQTYLNLGKMPVLELESMFKNAMDLSLYFGFAEPYDR
jgi:hypothetical protein